MAIELRTSTTKKLTMTPLMTPSTMIITEGACNNSCQTEEARNPIMKICDTDYRGYHVVLLIYDSISNLFINEKLISASFKKSFQEPKAVNHWIVKKRK